ncbi:MAG: DUF4167 domain-containing protein [Rhodospirillales bacterium]|nr:DUF4167 domain-containing protein [Rhodospirillales bacterium]
MRPGSSGKRSRNNRGYMRRGSGGGGGRNQSFESTGPDVKVRGTAQQVADKYTALARDASSSSDLVAAENYLQHAEHYQRIVNLHAERAAERAAEQQRERGDREERDDRSPRENRFQRQGREQDASDEERGEAEVESRTLKLAAEDGDSEGEEQPKPARWSRRKSNGSGNNRDSDAEDAAAVPAAGEEQWAAG